MMFFLVAVAQIVIFTLWIVEVSPVGDWSFLLMLAPSWGGGLLFLTLVIIVRLTFFLGRSAKARQTRAIQRALDALDDE